MTKRKGRAHLSEAPNLKRFRDDVADMVFDGAMKGASTAPTTGATVVKAAGRGLNRKEKRRQLKKEKKLRIQNFQMKKRGKEIIPERLKKKKTAGANAKNEGSGNDNSANGVKPEGTEDQITKKKKKKKKKKGEKRNEDTAEKEEDELEEWRRRAREIRTAQLLDANKEEDKVIRALEKNLGIKRKKSKKKKGGNESSEEAATTTKMPNSFKLDGLDFLLELCEETTRESAVDAERALEEAEERKAKAESKSGREDREGNVDEGDRDDDDDEIGFDSDGDISDGDVSDDLIGDSDDENCDDNKSSGTSKVIEDDYELGDKDDDDDDDEDEGEEREVEKDNGGAATYEDIYGRIRDAKTRVIIKDNRGVIEPGIGSGGRSDDVYNDANIEDSSNNVIKAKEEPKPSKYIPPSLRAAMQKCQSASTPDSENRSKVTRQMKGLLNRLSEANVASIATGVEEIYATMPRNLVTSTLTSVLMSACIQERQVTPPRFLLEHSLLVGVLHQTIGPEVGATILQECAKMFHEYRMLETVDEEMKRPDNVVALLCNLFLFKVVHCNLLFDLVKRLTPRFSEKDIELILILFRNVGFFLRKEDPSELKTRLADLQRRAAEEKAKYSSSTLDPSKSTKESTTVPSTTTTGFSKVQFMLDVLLAVKNNNMTKIPNYDAETPERMLKVLKSTLSAKKSSKGENSLRVSLAELVDADAKGKWWIVGSAWEGRQVGYASTASTATPLPSTVADSSSRITDDTLAKIETLATKQRMNTQLRKTIFAILLTSEDYVDAFQRLLKLNLNEKQEREIVYVLGSACLNEKVFNAYYAFLAAKLAAHEKRFQITLKYWFWDKYRELESMTEKRVVNLARLLAHLISKGQMSLTALKIVEFYKMGERKHLSKLLTTIMTTVLLDDDIDGKNFQSPFENISKSPKFAVLRQSLLLFLRHFLVVDDADTGDDTDNTDRPKLIRERVEKVAEYLKKK